MPAIKEISFLNGIKIVGDGIPSVDITIAQFPQTGSLSNREVTLNKLLQSYYEDKKLLSDLSFDSVRLGQLLPYERIEKIGGKDYLVTTLMYTQVHIYSLNPLKYIICCSDNPITGEWW